jgi:hypothetical protein
VAISTIVTFTPQLFIASNSDVNVWLTWIVVHDCPINIVWGRIEQAGGAITFTINWTGTELSGVTLDELMKSSTWINEILKLI